MRCPDCGADVQTGTTPTGEIVVLDMTPDPSSDAPRYRLLETVGHHSRIERVRDGQPGEFLPDHTFDCPGWNAGRPSGRR